MRDVITYMCKKHVYVRQYKQKVVEQAESIRMRGMTAVK